MNASIADELAALGRLTTDGLCARYAELHGHAARTRHKAYLLRKVAWRLQSRAEGGLTERARRRAAELADDADVRAMPPKAAPPRTVTPAAAEPCATIVTVSAPAPDLDPRLPAVGTVIVRPYKGAVLRVTVLADGFEMGGGRYRTLTAVAEQATGGHVNGFRFFKLDKPRSRS